MTLILVVDDEAQIRRALERALVARGYEVDAAADGVEALDHAAARLPDLIVLDLNMPVLGGLEVTRQIRSWSSVPILVLSVREDESDKIAALDSRGGRLPHEALRRGRVARARSRPASAARTRPAIARPRCSATETFGSTWGPAGSCATARMST